MPIRVPAAALLVAALLCGCTNLVRAPVVPPTALIYTQMKAPLDISLDATTRGELRGEASMVSILGLVSWGDASLAAAADAGQIRVMRHVDYEFLYVMGVYAKYTTIVYGD